MFHICACSIKMLVYDSRKVCRKARNGSRPAILIVFSEQSKEYTLVDVDTKKVVISRGVILDESAEWMTTFDIQNPVPRSTQVNDNEDAINLDLDEKSDEIPGKIESAEQDVQDRLPSQNFKLEDLVSGAPLSTASPSSFSDIFVLCNGLVHKQLRQSNRSQRAHDS